MATSGSVQVPLEAYSRSSASAAPTAAITSRHSVFVRITHWITTLCFFALLISGAELVISHPRFYWGETGNVNTKPLFKFSIPSSRSAVPTGYGYVLPDQNGWSRYLHFQAAWVVVITGLLFVILSLFTGHLRRNLLPRRSDFSWRAFSSEIGTHLRFARPSEAESQRLLTRHSLAREFSQSQISTPFANGLAPLPEAYKRLQAGGFADWRLSINGMVDNPGSFSLAESKSFPRKSQITQIACEEGWSYIAEWIGVPLSHVLHLAGVHPQARYVVYFSIEPIWWDSIDMADALHPQTFLAYGMNGGEIPTGHGGPLRMRVPRQLGYKNVKFITHLTVTDNLKSFGKGLGSLAPEVGYAWYAGI